MVVIILILVDSLGQYHSAIACSELPLPLRASPQTRRESGLITQFNPIWKPRYPAHGELPKRSETGNLFVDLHEAGLA